MAGARRRARPGRRRARCRRDVGRGATQRPRAARHLAAGAPARDPVARRRPRRHGAPRRARWSPGLGRRRGLGAGAVDADRAARVAPPHRSRPVGPHRQRALARELAHPPPEQGVRHRPRRRLLDRLLVAPREPVARRPARLRRRREGLGDVPAASPGTPGAGGGPTGRRDRPRHRRRDGDHARPEPAARRRGDRARPRGARLHAARTAHGGRDGRRRRPRRRDGSLPPLRPARRRDERRVDPGAPDGHRRPEALRPAGAACAGRRRRRDRAARVRRATADRPTSRTAG